MKWWVGGWVWVRVSVWAWVGGCVGVDVGSDARVHTEGEPTTSRWTTRQTRSRSKWSSTRWSRPSTKSTLPPTEPLPSMPRPIESVHMNTYTKVNCACAAAYVRCFRPLECASSAGRSRGGMCECACILCVRVPVGNDSPHFRSAPVTDTDPRGPYPILVGRGDSGHPTRDCIPRDIQTPSLEPGSQRVTLPLDSLRVI